ncbi:unnamed protein product [Caenorhabditis bovis]|uniref:PHD-type domain-containing protein n=1 Tax=Caenorhabditis bovis TaxID=2654633 RepID=A0A8S1F7S1_9PELO|nr:unnamed protein product [Caenorhabditis bovis]
MSSSQSEREFGNEIGNTMTASQELSTSADAVLCKNLDSLPDKTPSMEKITNGGETSTSLLSNALATEIYTIVHNSNSDLDELMEDVEDHIEDFFIGETVINSGKEYIIESKERRGGLVMYTMTDGTKIGHRDLRRKKGISTDFLRKLIETHAKFDGKCWKIDDDTRKLYDIKENVVEQKLAPIFCRKSSENAKKESDSSDEENVESSERRLAFNGRASGGIAPSSKFKKMQEKLKKNEERKKLKEQKLKEKEEEKQRKIEEKLKEKAKKAEAKTNAKKSSSNGGGIGQFLTKTPNSKTSSGVETGTPSVWAAKRLKNATNRLEEAWKKRDSEQFNEACAYCESQLSKNQIKNIENPIWRFAVQKIVDRNADKALMKNMKPEKRKEYRQQMLERRRDEYRLMESRIRAHFSEVCFEEDLTITSEKLRIEMCEQLENPEIAARCLEICEFFVSMKEIMNFSERITANDLSNSFKTGREGFEKYTWKIYDCLLENLLQNETYAKIAHMNARLREFPLNVNTITEATRAFLVRSFETRNIPDSVDDEEDDESKLKKEEIEENMEFDEIYEGTEANGEVQTRQKLLEFFNDGKCLEDFPAEHHLELIEHLIQLLIDSQIVRDAFNAEPDSIEKYRSKIRAFQTKIDETTTEIGEIPVETRNIEMLSRKETKEIEMRAKRKEHLERKLIDLKEELQILNSKMATEKDLFMRVFRVPCIGQDRHLRKYYWTAYNRDGGIWVQDFGTLNYEKWVRKCVEQKLDVDGPIESLPKFEPDEKIEEKWYRISNIDELENLKNQLLKSGRREGELYKFLKANLEDIRGSITRDFGRQFNRSPSPEEHEPYLGVFGAFKVQLMAFLKDLVESKMTSLSNVEEIAANLENANDLQKLKSIFREIFDAILPSFITYRHSGAYAASTKHFSILQPHRFQQQIASALNVSALHLLLEYLDGRIKWENSINQQRCLVCRRKDESAQKMRCRNCIDVYHYSCVRPRITLAQFEDSSFVENWLCGRCRSAEIRKKRQERIEKTEDDDDSGDDDDEEEEKQRRGDQSDSSPALSDVEGDDDDDRMHTYSRKAKKRANTAMAAMVQYEKNGTIGGSEPLPKRRLIKKDVQEFFESIENANPRLYRLLIYVPSGGREILNGRGELDLNGIENNLKLYRTVSDLRDDVTAFFRNARNYIETHNNRKLDELDLMISKLELDV